MKIWETPELRERIISPLHYGKAVKNMEIVFRHRNGDLHNYIYSAEPILLNGEICIISIFFDITEKKKLEDALRLSEEMYKAVFECTGSAIGIVRNDVLILINKGEFKLKVKSGEVRDVYCLTAPGPDDSQYVVTLIDMSGIDLIEYIRRSDQKVPILVLSGFDETFMQNAPSRRGLTAIL